VKGEGKGGAQRDDLYANRALGPDDMIWTKIRGQWGNTPHTLMICTGTNPGGNVNIVFRLLIFVFICTITITITFHAINE
jgi:hypothetical protein